MSVKPEHYDVIKKPVISDKGRLFGDDRLLDHVVMFRFHAHFRRASKASIPALVITNVSRLRIS